MVLEPRIEKMKPRAISFRLSFEKVPILAKIEPSII